MSDLQTTENFLKVMQDMTWPEPRPVFYRLYHDDQGRPLFYSMEDLAGTYIEVDQTTYVLSPYNVRVVDGKLTVLPSRTSVTKLRPHAKQGVTCDLRDICVIVDSQMQHQRWSLETNDVD